MRERYIEKLVHLYFRYCNENNTMYNPSILNKLLQRHESQIDFEEPLLLGKGITG